MTTVIARRVVLLMAVTDCSATYRQQPPKRVLELACGSGYWSAVCRDYLAGLGHEDVSFTGLDIVPLAGDLPRQGIDWKFVQHDLRKLPLPFDDEEFDIVVMKDLSMVIPLGAPSQRILDEATRILKSGGALEIWEVRKLRLTSLQTNRNRLLKELIYARRYNLSP